MLSIQILWIVTPSVLRPDICILVYHTLIRTVFNNKMLRKQQIAYEACDRGWSDYELTSEKINVTLKTEILHYSVMLRKFLEDTYNNVVAYY